MTMIHKKRLWNIAMCAGLLNTSLYAGDEMVKSIMKLRADVESLYTKVDENKDAYKAQMKSYTFQISDNEAQINRQETALKLTEQNLKKVEDELKDIGSSSKDIKPIIHKAIDALAIEIKAGIPFKVQERIVALEKIRADLANRLITQEKALALVWASHDDALRLTKEIGLFKQEISIDGEDKLAKIAKIGSVMMFFATPDDRVGFVKKNDDGSYVYQVASKNVTQKQIVKLFDALQKQIRTGYFTLPNALLLRGVN